MNQQLLLHFTLLFLFRLPACFIFPAVRLQTWRPALCLAAAGQVNISVLLTGDSVQHRSHFCFCLPTLDVLHVALRVLSCDKFLCLKVPVSAKSVRLQERIGPSVTRQINICWIRAERGRKTGRGTKNSQMGRRKGNLPQKYTKSTMTSCVCASNS